MSTARPIHIMPDMRVIHPDYGDMTADVARELQALNQQAADRAYAQAHARQLKIAKVCGTEARQMDNGMRLIAQIDEDVFNYWEMREGKEFWTKQGDLNYMLKKHPELAVNAKRENPLFGYTGTPNTGVRGKRGRWAI